MSKSGSRRMATASCAAVVRDIGAERQALLDLSSQGAFLPPGPGSRPRASSSRRIATAASRSPTARSRRSTASRPPISSERPTRISIRQPPRSSTSARRRPRGHGLPPAEAHRKGAGRLPRRQVHAGSRRSRSRSSRRTAARTPILGVSADITALQGGGRPPEAQVRAAPRASRRPPRVGVVRPLGLQGEPRADLDHRRADARGRTDGGLAPPRRGSHGPARGVRLRPRRPLRGPTRVFPKSDYPAYFRALTEERIVAAGDVRSDPRTRELSAAYLEPLRDRVHARRHDRLHGTVIGVVVPRASGGPFATGRSKSRISRPRSPSLVSRGARGGKRLALEEQLRHAQKMEALGQLAGGISHDFNNLLNIILGHGELAAQTLPADHPAAAHLANIVGACSRAADLVRKILTFSRGQVLRVAPAEFGAVLREFSTLLTRVLGEDIELSVSDLERADDRGDRSGPSSSRSSSTCAPTRGRRCPAGAPDPGRPAHCERRRRGSSESTCGSPIPVTASTKRPCRAFGRPFFTTKSEGTGLRAVGRLRDRSPARRHPARGEPCRPRQHLPRAPPPPPGTPRTRRRIRRGARRPRAGDDPPRRGRGPDPRAGQGQAWAS